MLNRLANFLSGFRTRVEAQCGNCNRAYSQANPFVEGISGALICSSCLSKLAEQPRPAQQTYETKSGTSQNATNPYQTPTADTKTARCDFCGEHNKMHMVFGDRTKRQICYDCIGNSKTLLKQQSHNV